MSKAEAGRQDIASDVIGEGSSLSGGGDAAHPSGEVGEGRNVFQEHNVVTRPVNLRTDRNVKPPSYRPMRTSSAPPEEHPIDGPKVHFQPTKTQQTFVPTSDAFRRAQNMHQSGYRQPSGRGRDDPSNHQGPPPHHGGGAATHDHNATHDSAHPPPPGNDTPRTASTAPSPPTTTEGMAIATHLSTDAADRPHPHSPAGGSAAGDPRDHSTNGQSSPVYPAGAGRNYRSGSGAGPMGSGSGSNSPLTGGAGGFSRDSPHGYRDGPNRDRDRDPRVSGGRLGGRRGNQPMQQNPGGYNQRGGPPMGMSMHDHQGNPINRPYGYNNAGPPPPMAQQQPQQWQQPHVQFVDQYGNPVPGPPQQAPQQQFMYGQGPQGMQHQVVRQQQLGGAPGQHPGMILQHGVPPPHQAAPQQGPPMFGQMPPQQAVQQQQMMQMYPQQYVLQPQPGQRFVQTPQGLMVQSGVFPAGYGAEYSAEQFNANMMGQMVTPAGLVDMQTMAFAPGTQVSFVNAAGQPIHQMQMQMPPTAQPPQQQQFAHYAQHPGHAPPPHVQMPHQSVHQPQMYAAGPQEMAGYGQPHMMPTQMQVGQQGMPAQMGHAPQMGMPAGAPLYGGYPPAGHMGHHPQQQQQQQPGGHYQGGPPRHSGYQGNNSRPHSAQDQHGGPPHGPSPRQYQHRQTPSGGVPPVDSASVPGPPAAAAASPSVTARTPSVTTSPAPATLGNPSATAARSTDGENGAPAEVAPLPPSAAPQEGTPASTRGKVLVYKKKDGSALDLQDFKKPAAEVAAVPEHNEVQAGSSQPSEAPKGSETVTDKLPVTAGAPATEAVKADEGSNAVPAEQQALAATSAKKAGDGGPTVPSVHEQLQGLRISAEAASAPAPAEDTPLSPAIKFASLPVSISSAPVSAYGTTSSTASAASIEVPAAPASTPATGDTSAAQGTPTGAARSRKTLLKEALARADAQDPAAAADMLSAYTDAPATAATPAVVPSAQNLTLAASPATKAATAPAPTSTEDSLPDSWDEAAEVPLPPAMPTPEASTAKEAATQRSLRPGGMHGFNMNLHQATAITRYTKQEIVALRPPDKTGHNPLPMYSNISTTEPTTPGSTQKGNRDSGQWGKSMRGDGRPSEGGGDGWKRGDTMPSPAPGSSGKHRKSGSNAGPMPKKVITDPMVLLATETTAILNKITPQTFEKLSQNMLDLNVTNIAQMNLVIELIFEKAVQEQGFANLYAALCTFLNTNATNWQFYSVFRVVNLEPSQEYEYFWIKDCVFPAVYAGPFFSMPDILAALHSPSLPPMQPVSFAPEVAEYVLLNAVDLLVKISRHEKANAYYVTYMPFKEVEEERRSEEMFGDHRSALKDAKSKNFFRAKLVTNCQTEFQKSTRNESIYSELEIELQELEANKANMSEADFATKAAEIEEKRLKIKRRMLGNIRFVGELFKQKLLAEATIQACIADLMGTPDSWKEISDEQVIECLCHLLTTVGERLEAKTATSPEASRNFNLCFDRLRALSRDKSLNSRMRFAIEEVVALRDNRWQKRRSAEAPQKIADLHKKMQHEQQNPHAAGVGARPLPVGGNQRPQPTQPPRILSRGGPGGASSGRMSTQDVRRAGAPGAEMSRTISASAYEVGYRGSSGNAGHDAPQAGPRAQAGDPLRRTQSEYSSGAATPTSVGSGAGGGGAAVFAGTEPPRHERNLSLGDHSIADEGEVDFEDKTMQNRAKSVVSEFIEQNDIQEVKLFLADGPRGICGHFILQLIDKCLNAKKGPVLPQLQGLLKDEGIVEELLAGQIEVQQALRWCEEFKCLVDTTMDYKEAPERFASVMAALVKARVVGSDTVKEIAQEAHANCVEELMSDEEESRAVFDRFSRQLASELE